jgi:mannose-6-phosphate isomerase
VYICIDGEFLICWDDNSEKISKGETVLLPAMIKEVVLKPVSEARVLEIYINSENPIL